jgi:hypothetical protein
MTYPQDGQIEQDYSPIVIDGYISNPNKTVCVYVNGDILGTAISAPTTSGKVWGLNGFYYKLETPIPMHMWDVAVGELVADVQLQYKGSSDCSETLSGTQTDIAYSWAVGTSYATTCASGASSWNDFLNNCPSVGGHATITKPCTVETFCTATDIAAGPWAARPIGNPSHCSVLGGTVCTPAGIVAYSGNSSCTNSPNLSCTDSFGADYANGLCFYGCASFLYYADGNGGCLERGGIQGIYVGQNPGQMCNSLGQPNLNIGVPNQMN